MTQPVRELFRVFGRIGLLSFGGPAAQIALMHEALVERTRWLSEAEFLRALSLCMLLPGPEAMQLATYAGWRLRGVAGGLIAGGLFVLPGALVIAVLAAVYIAFGNVPWVQAAFVGIKATVIVVVVQALLRLGKKALIGPEAWMLAGFAFLALFVLGLPFPVLIALAAIYGASRARSDHAVADVPASQKHNLFRTIAVWGGLWLLPLIGLWLAGAQFLLQIGLFFSQLAVVTFGGAYAVLAYMTQSVVQDHGWITTGQMIDALGLAETTPGPLILVTEFVAILAGYGAGGAMLATAAGLVALWTTFVPCFLWIFAAGPFVERLSSRPRLASALQAITAAVVGVIANLSVWFALHVLFTRVAEHPVLALPIPEPASLDTHAVLLTILAALLLLLVRLPLPATLGCMALAAMAVGVFGMA